jgi:CRP/FNR family transcriptional regulator, cyclic AMP receptor protein
MIEVLPPEQQRLILAACRRRAFPAGQVIFHEGDPADSLHLLTTGRVTVRVTTPTGETATLTVLGPGATFGEIALVSQPRARTATIAALDNCETLTLNVRDFQTLREHHPHVERFLVELLAAQVRRLSSQLLEALYVPADRRVLRRLLDLLALLERPLAPGDPITLAATQDMLATMAGTSRATANHALQRAHHAGYLHITRGHVHITNLDKLRQLAQA